MTTISSAAVNSDFSDIATALTASLARDGQGGMTAVLPLSPLGFTYTSDLNTGMYRTGSDTQAVKCGGTDIVTVSTTGAAVSGTLAVTGAISQNGSPLIPIGLGPVPWSGTAAPSGWVFVGKLYSRTTYAALWAFAQAEIALGSSFYTNGDGSTTFGVGLNMPGRVPACNDSISGSAAGNLTLAVFGTSPAVVGNVGGAQTHTLTVPQIPQLTVSGTASGGLVPILSLGTVGLAAGAFQFYSASGGSATNLSVSPQTISGVTSGDGGAHNNVQPTIITNYIIYAGV